MRKIKLSPSWSLSNEENETLGSELFALLSVIHRAGTLAEAAKQTNISYRHAWNLVNHWKKFFGSDLVVFTRGKGASLTELGEKLRTEFILGKCVWQISYIITDFRKLSSRK